MHQNYQRQSREKWQQIVEQFQASGQSGVQFCKERGVAYASFSKWRQTFSRPSTATELANALPESEAAFVDLQSLMNRSSAWKIVLRLGSDIELVLSQP